MLKLMDGSLIQEQFTSYTFDGAPPRREGEIAFIRVVTGQLVKVMLRKGVGGAMWLVADLPARSLTPRYVPVVESIRDAELTRVSKTYLQRQNEAAAKVAAVLASKRVATSGLA